MTRNFYLARAFTFIELLVVIVVLGILFTIAYPAFISAQERAKVTKDMNNLRQIGLATQTYMNDNDGVLPGSTIVTWMSHLELNRKYLSAWGGLQSPFDGRPPSELGDGTTPISYGINVKVYPNNAAISADRITKPTAFILFAPAQDSATKVNFQGTALNPGPPFGVTLFGDSGTVTSNPGGVPTGGTQNNRNRINALFADLHCETMAWAAFTSTTANPGEPDQWTPYIPYP